MIGNLNKLNNLSLVTNCAKFLSRLSVWVLSKKKYDTKNPIGTESITT